MTDEFLIKTLESVVNCLSSLEEDNAIEAVLALRGTMQHKEEIGFSAGPPPE